MNKLIRSLIYLVLVACFLNSCNEQKKEGSREGTVKSWGEAKAEFVSELSSSDTANVKTMAIKCMDLLNLTASIKH